MKVTLFARGGTLYARNENGYEMPIWTGSLCMPDGTQTRWEEAEIVLEGTEGHSTGTALPKTCAAVDDVVAEAIRRARIKIGE